MDPPPFLPDPADDLLALYALSSLPSTTQSLQHVLRHLPGPVLLHTPLDSKNGLQRLLAHTLEPPQHIQPTDIDLDILEEALTMIPGPPLGVLQEHTDALQAVQLAEQRAAKRAAHLSRPKLQRKTKRQKTCRSR